MTSSNIHPDDKRIFILGDSRTGTTSLHRFMTSAGLNSTHYYFQESGVKEGGDDWDNLKKFIDESGYHAFSDYPTRSYFRELMENYPEAYFILSRRSDLEVWQRSMSSFMGKFGIEIDLPKLSEYYLGLNEEIRKKASESGVRFLEVNIDEDDAENSKRLSAFLDLANPVQLGRENATDAYDNRIWSKRLTFFGVNEGDIVSYAEGLCAPNKGMPSEYGWVFLVNDGSHYMSFLYGLKAWSDEEAKSAADVLSQRQVRLDEQNATYLKFIIPEKAAVYPEFLPRAFHDREAPNGRPAQLLAEAKPETTFYPLDTLHDAKSYGTLYFRGDSHANWLGAYVIYNRIVDELNQKLPQASRKKPIPLRELQPDLAGYSGDIYGQLPPEYKTQIDGTFQNLLPRDTFEILLRYQLPEKRRQAKPVEFPSAIADGLGDRPYFAFRKDANLPRAIIFRDSTSDWLVDLLAEHFSESLFIWHKGLVLEDVIESFKPDVVLHIMAERFVSTYPNAKPFSRLSTSFEQTPPEPQSKRKYLSWFKK